MQLYCKTKLYEISVLPLATLPGRYAKLARLRSLPAAFRRLKDAAPLFSKQAQSFTSLFQKKKLKITK